MIKRALEVLFFLIPVGLIVVLAYISFNAVIEKPQKLTLDITPTIKSQPAGLAKSKTVYYTFELVDLADLKLIVNSSKKEAEDLIAEHNCLAAINGGFYAENYQPLGLVVNDGQELSPAVESELLNGYLWLSSLGGFGITRSLPESDLNIGLQSGPLLFENGIKQNLEIANDKQARRSVVAVLKNGNLWFLTIFNRDSVFLGPHLADLPNALEEIAAKEGLVIVDALNLDGGSAAMFKNAEIFLNEYKPVGEILCVVKE